jgi:hypothetical protein
MKKYIIIAVVSLLTTLMSAQTTPTPVNPAPVVSGQPCLAVYPMGGNRLTGFAAGGYVGLALAHGQRFAYLESVGVSVSEVKVNYKKKDLEKLEKNGVRIVVTTKEAFTVRNQHIDQNTGDASSGQSTITKTASAGCQ